MKRATRGGGHADGADSPVKYIELIDDTATRVYGAFPGTGETQGRKGTPRIYCRSSVLVAIEVGHIVLQATLQVKVCTEICSPARCCCVDKIRGFVGLAVACLVPPPKRLKAVA